VRRHSEKPAVFYEIIERYFPTLPKIELHARGAVARPGWDVWGLEAPIDRQELRADPLQRKQVDQATRVET
jgi:N6-adenosine-specific RNA methylase IME4